MGDRSLLHGDCSVNCWVNLHVMNVTLDLPFYNMSPLRFSF